MQLPVLFCCITLAVAALKVIDIAVTAWFAFKKQDRSLLRGLETRRKNASLLPSLFISSLSFGFKWPIVTIALTYSAIACLRFSHSVSVWATAFVLILIWAETLHIFFEFLTGSYKHALFLQTATPGLPKTNLLGDGSDVKKINEVRAFVKVLTGLLGTAILGYAGVYRIHIATCGPGVFHGLSPESIDAYHEPMTVKMLYFSLVTTSTVGYGDIYPVTLIAHLLVSSQITLNILLVVYLILVFSSVSGGEENQPEVN